MTDLILPDDWAKLPSPRPMNAEDRSWYVRYGEDLEARFIEQIVPRLGIAIKLNPAKNHNRYAPDLIVMGKQLADLKHQSKPFFTSWRYGIAPQFAVTFNHKDYVRYSENYPDIVIYWWVEREDETGYGATVRRMNAVWRCPLTTLATAIENGKVHLHEYDNRKFDQNGNAKASYVFDVRDFELLWREL